METKKSNKHPIAVLISDIHFTVNTLEVASQALLKAQFKAKMLNVPLVIAGDLLDQKAIIRAEVANRLIELLSVKDKTETIILVGNHDLINERNSGTFQHSLNFLKPYVTVVERPLFGELKTTTVALIPYVSEQNKIKDFLYEHPFFEDFDEAQKVEFYAERKKTIIIMHQGITGSNSGEYIQDRTALNKEDVAGFRVISGHYHTRQTIDLPDGGKWDYIGNPYSLNFGEANDPEKGFQVLYDDGSLEFVPTNLRKHVVIDLSAEMTDAWMGKIIKNHIQFNAILWVKIRGSSDELTKITKSYVAQELDITQDFRLDLIPTEEINKPEETARPQTQLELFDSTIDSLTNTAVERKDRLKQLYKDLIK